MQSCDVFITNVRPNSLARMGLDAPACRAMPSPTSSTASSPASARADRTAAVRPTTRCCKRRRALPASPSNATARRASRRFSPRITWSRRSPPAPSRRRWYGGSGPARGRPSKSRCMRPWRRSCCRSISVPRRSIRRGAARRPPRARSQCAADRDAGWMDRDHREHRRAGEGVPARGRSRRPHRRSALLERRGTREELKRLVSPAGRVDCVGHDRALAQGFCGARHPGDALPCAGGDCRRSSPRRGQAGASARCIPRRARSGRSGRPSCSTATRCVRSRSAKPLGSDTRKVLAEAGYSDAEIDALVKSGAAIDGQA